MIKRFSSTKNKKILIDINKQTKFKRYFEFIIGCIIISLSYNLFLSPNNIASGGVGGIAIIIKKYLNFNNSIFIFICNIILLIISYFLLEKDKTKRSILGSLLYPIFINLTFNITKYISFQGNEKLLYSIFGGVLSGIGAGMIFKAGFTTGGTDIVNQIISKYTKISIGKSILICDGTIVLLSGLAFGPQSLMYNFITLYIISYISDRVILGTSDSKAFYIITKQPELMKDYIINYLDKAVTIIDAKGGYKGENIKILLCVLPTRDYYRLREGIIKIDSEAFFLVTDAYEVFGSE